MLNSGYIHQLWDEFAELSAYWVYSVFFAGTQINRVLHADSLVADIVTNPSEQLLMLLSVMFYQVGLI